MFFSLGVATPPEDKSCLGCKYSCLRAQKPYQARLANVSSETDVMLLILGNSLCWAHCDKINTFIELITSSTDRCLKLKHFCVGFHDVLYNDL